MRTQKIKEKNKVNEIFFIGIAGPSGAGKTTVGAALKRDYPHTFEHVRLDDYLKSPSNFPKIGKYINWEDPRNLNFDKLVKHLTLLKKGKEVKSHFYLYVPKRKIFPLNLRPKKLVVVEGFLLFTSKRVVNLLDYKIYLHIPIEVILRRRALRIGKKETEISDYDRKVVIPEYEKHGLSQIHYSDALINGNRPLKEVEKDVRSAIKNKFDIKHI